MKNMQILVWNVQILKIFQKSTVGSQKFNTALVGW